jgi:hypothetical protein
MGLRRTAGGQQLLNMDTMQYVVVSDKLLEVVASGGWYRRIIRQRRHAASEANQITHSDHSLQQEAISSL